MHSTACRKSTVMQRKRQARDQAATHAVADMPSEGWNGKTCENLTRDHRAPESRLVGQRAQGTAGVEHAAPRVRRNFWHRRAASRPSRIHVTRPSDSTTRHVAPRPAGLWADARNDVNACGPSVLRVRAQAACSPALLMLRSCNAADSMVLVNTLRRTQFKTMPVRVDR